jgi:hypothetical protein
VSASTSQLLRKYGNYLYSTGALSGTFRTSGIRIFDVASRPGRPSTAYIGPQDQVEARGMYSLGNGILFETEDTGSRLNVYQIGP